MIKGDSSCVCGINDILSYSGFLQSRALFENKRCAGSGGGGTLMAHHRSPVQDYKRTRANTPGLEGLRLTRHDEASESTTVVKIPSAGAVGRLRVAVLYVASRVLCV